MKNNLYKYLPVEIRDMLTYIFGNERKEKKFFSFQKFYGFKTMEIKDGVITKADYDDGYFNNISWDFGYKGIEIFVNNYAYSKELGFHYYYDKEHNNLPFRLRESVIKNSSIIEINKNSHEGMNVWID